MVGALGAERLARGELGSGSEGGGLVVEREVGGVADAEVQEDVEELPGGDPLAVGRRRGQRQRAHRLQSDAAQAIGREDDAPVERLDDAELELGRRASSSERSASYASLSGTYIRSVSFDTRVRHTRARLSISAFSTEVHDR